MINFLSKLKKFLQDVANDTRIPDRDKKVVMAMIVLVISPIDLIPDWIPFFGILDDLLLISLIVDYFFAVLDHQVILSHYPWGMKSFTALRKGSKFFSSVVPRSIKSIIWKYEKDPY